MEREARREKKIKKLLHLILLSDTFSHVNQRVYPPVGRVASSLIRRKKHERVEVRVNGGSDHRYRLCWQSRSESDRPTPPRQR